MNIHIKKKKKLVDGWKRKYEVPEHAKYIGYALKYGLCQKFNIFIFNFYFITNNNKNALQSKAYRQLFWKTLGKIHTKFHSPC